MTKVSKKSKLAVNSAQSDVLTLEEAALFLRIPKTVLEQHLVLENIPGRNIGGHWRFFKPAPEQWLSQQTRSETSMASNKEILLAQAGAFANDPTFPALLESIKKNRKRINKTQG